MNLFEMIPDEIIALIIENLNCDQILQLKEVYTKFNIIIKSSNLLRKKT